MSYKNNTKYNRTQEEPIQETVEEEPIQETVEEEIVETEPVEEIVETEPVEEAVETESLDEVEPTKIGVVTDCAKLNVRAAASKEADVVTTLNALAEVIVDPNQSTDEFYKIITESYVEGYCMKKFIAVRP